MVDERQGCLFSGDELQSVHQWRSPLTHRWNMGSVALHQWKSTIAHYQDYQLSRCHHHQPSLWTMDAMATHVDPVTINPFSLKPETIAFWRLPASDKGDACLYFVIDSNPGGLPFILYIGETCRSHQRWKGEHDCKRYIANYKANHFSCGLQASITIGFWWDALVDTRWRQQLELALIDRWRSPFNKENWQIWGMPFA